MSRSPKHTYCPFSGTMEHDKLGKEKALMTFTSSGCDLHEVILSQSRIAFNLEPSPSFYFRGRSSRLSVGMKLARSRAVRDLAKSFFDDRNIEISKSGALAFLA